jgi:hypothetical protein
MGYIEGAGQLCVSCDRKHSEGGISRFAWEVMIECNEITKNYTKSEGIIHFA